MGESGCEQRKRPAGPGSAWLLSGGLGQKCLGFHHPRVPEFSFVIIFAQGSSLVFRALIWAGQPLGVTFVTNVICAVFCPLWVTLSRALLPRELSHHAGGTSAGL